MLSQLCLKTLPYTPAAQVPACFDRWQHLMRAIDGVASPPDAPPLGPDAIDAIGWYALAVTDVDSLVLAETFARILHRNDTTIMSTLESTFQKGLARGLAEGLAKGHAEGHAEGHADGQAHTLLRLLALRFGALDPTVIERVRAGSSADLDRWTARVLDAKTLAAVFDGDPAS
ncbi:MAG: hypothetical protein H6835_01805 [Planctomycetes bacterium]|nr:hypothetical protein [Planctomycetota bacterium]